MTPARRSDRYQASAVPGEGRAADHLTVIGGVDIALALPAQQRATCNRVLIPVVWPPTSPGWTPTAPRVLAEATLQVKRYRGGAANEERYSATLHAATAAPAALLAALADAAAQIEELVREGSPEDHMILSIIIRR